MDGMSSILGGPARTHRVVWGKLSFPQTVFEKGGGKKNPLRKDKWLDIYSKVHFNSEQIFWHPGELTTRGIKDELRSA